MTSFLFRLWAPTDYTLSTLSCVCVFVCFGYGSARVLSPLAIGLSWANMGLQRLMRDEQIES